MRAKSQTCRKELLEARARWMRREPTLTESVLWERLRGKRLGVVFRRQVVIGRYIVDFCAPAVRLVVEVDGGYHKLSSLPRRKAGPCLGARGVSRRARERPGGVYGH